MLQQTNPRIALVAGGSGFVGGLLLRLLLQAPDYARVYAVSRRPLSLEHPKLANRILPLEQARAQLAGLQCHDVYCCLGSTLRQAGSEQDRQKVDLDLTVSFARAARSLGATRFVVLSAAGADRDARNPYLRTKGEMEQAVREPGFESLDILRPGLLLGWRGELRPLELLAGLAMPLVNPLLRGRHARWRGIAAGDVAAAMLGASRSQRRGMYVYEGLALPQLAAAGRRNLS
ncbi:MAG: NAD(P)H-binding protein [Steroidobacteraceae bacterium]